MNGVLAVLYADLLRLSKARSAILLFLATPAMALIMTYTLSGIFPPLFTAQLILSFVVIGMIAPTIFIGSSMVLEKEKDLFKDLLAAPISIGEIAISRLLFSVAIISIAPLAVIFSSSLFGYVNFHSGIGLTYLLIGVFLLSLTFGAIALLVGLFTEKLSSYQPIMVTIIFAMALFSNTLTPLSLMPRAFQIIASVNPVTYLFEAANYSIGVYYEFEPTFSLGILMLGAISLAVLCFFMYNRKYG